MSSPVPNEWVELQLGTTANNSTTYNALLNLTALKAPGVAVTAVEQTARSSTRKTYRAGLIPGTTECTFSVQYNVTDHAALDTLATDVANATRPWKVVHKNNANSAVANAAFNAFLTAWEPEDGETESDYIKSGTLQITGAITYS